MSDQESKQDKIDRVQANLPLPDAPPNPPDSNSMDARTVNIGKDKVQGKLGTAQDDGLRGPASQGSDVRQEGGGFSGIGVAPRNEQGDMKMVEKEGNHKDPGV